MRSAVPGGDPVQQQAQAELEPRVVVGSGAVRAYRRKA
jgi:hypothetical protein